MKSLRLKISALALLVMAGCVDNPVISNANAEGGRDLPRPALSVDMQVIGDSTGEAREFPVNTNAAHYRAYIQASENERYRLRVRNNTGQRIGLVIAVDGRNIISGARSNLNNSERMYILEPYGSGDYEGWRSDQNRTNRFFFTDAGSSYAAAWGDNSAMGVIAMAVYPEKYRPPPPPMAYEDRMAAAPAMAPAPAPAAREAGTGYGESTWSPSHTVDFDPENRPMEKLFLKYEWRDTLCQKHILPECRVPPPPPPNNRFWPDNGGYAPPPPPQPR